MGLLRKREQPRLANYNPYSKRAQTRLLDTEVFLINGRDLCRGFGITPSRPPDSQRDDSDLGAFRREFA
jgi:hypothetical protein